MFGPAEQGVRSKKIVIPEDLIEKKLAEASSLEDLAEVLKLLLGEGIAVWEDGSLYYIRQLVARINGLRIEIFAREHAPPHFHVHGGGVDAIFSLESCEHLQGTVGRREKALIEWWYLRSRERLIQTWNSTRPSDCPVGKFSEYALLLTSRSSRSLSSLGRFALRTSCACLRHHCAAGAPRKAPLNWALGVIGNWQRSL